MASPSERAFWKSLQTRAFSAVYYFYGDDEYLKDEAVRALLAAAVEPATRDFNLDVRSAGDVDAETVGSLLGTPPMMAERRVVVLRDAGALKKEPRAVVDRFVDRLAERAGPAATDLVLVLVAAGGERAKPDRRLERPELPGVLAVEFAPLASERVPKWIAHHAKESLGATIAPGAAELLHRAVGGDLPALAAELDKLASYAAGREIDEAAVAAVVGVRRGETLGDFLDRVAERDAPAALGMIDHVLELPKTTAVSVVMALTTQALALAHAAALRERGVPAGRLEGELFALLKAAPGAYTGRPWGDATRAWAAAARHWEPRTLDAALDALLAADVALKETRLSSDAQVLATLALALCGGRAGSGERVGNASGSRMSAGTVR